MDLKSYVATTIGTGNLKEALSACLTWAGDNNSPLYNQFILFQSQFSRAENSHIAQLTTDEAYNVTISKLSNSVIEYAKNIPAGATIDIAAPETPIPKSAGNSKGSTSNLLFLAANPSDTAELDLNLEFVKLQSKLQDSPYSVKTQWATTPSQLQDALLNYHPRIIHFSGHGTAGAAVVAPDNSTDKTRVIGNIPVDKTIPVEETEGIFLQDNKGNKKFVSGIALANLFGTCIEKFSIDVVVLNACHSALQADAIVKSGVKFVIGMSRSVPDDTAIQFTEGFYRALAKENDVAFAFKLALNNIELEGGTGEDIPKLYQKATI